MWEAILMLFIGNSTFLYSYFYIYRHKDPCKIPSSLEVHSPWGRNHWIWERLFLDETVRRHLNLLGSRQQTAGSSLVLTWDLVFIIVLLKFLPMSQHSLEHRLCYLQFYLQALPKYPPCFSLLVTLLRHLFGMMAECESSLFLI